MYLLFIVNPVAGKGLALKSIHEIESFCSDKKIKYDIKQTLYKGHGTQLAKKAVNMGYTAIIAVGGDGTLFEVANGVAGSSIPIGVLPAGTGNDFARSLGIPENVTEALNIIAKAKSKPVDVGWSGKTCFMNVASVGFDAEIVRDLTRIKKWIPRKAAYYILIFFKFLFYKHKKVRVHIDDKTIDSNILLVAIANGYFYGGGINVNPYGRLDDGSLDVILIADVPRMKIPILFWKFAKGKHSGIPYIKVYKGKKILIESNEILDINADGDIISSTPAEFSIKPLSLNFIC